MNTYKTGKVLLALKKEKEAQRAFEEGSTQWGDVDLQLELLQFSKNPHHVVVQQQLVTSPPPQQQHQQQPQQPQKQAASIVSGSTVAASASTTTKNNSAFVVTHDEEDKVTIQSNQHTTVASSINHLLSLSLIFSPSSLFIILSFMTTVTINCLFFLLIILSFLCVNEGGPREDYQGSTQRFSSRGSARDGATWHWKCERGREDRIGLPSSQYGQLQQGNRYLQRAIEGQQQDHRYHCR